MGRNGVGKTTMLRLMGGILAPTRGEVRIHDGKKASLLTLGLGFKPDLSGRDNAVLAAMLQGSSRKQAETFINDIWEFSELGDSFGLPVKNYSSGMRARLAFTTALMTHVDILLIDEILSVGDAHFRQKAQAAMQGRITSGQTVVFVSHMADQVKAMCNRVIWLEDGKIVAQGDAVEVTDAYIAKVTQSGNTGQDKRQNQIDSEIENQRQKQAQLEHDLKNLLESTNLSQEQFDEAIKKQLQNPERSENLEEVQKQVEQYLRGQKK
jgi:lipopolysaccharide transport system ATP-binding protein